MQPAPYPFKERMIWKNKPIRFLVGLVFLGASSMHTLLERQKDVVWKMFLLELFDHESGLSTLSPLRATQREPVLKKGNWPGSEYMHVVHTVHVKLIGLQTGDLNLRRSGKSVVCDILGYEQLKPLDAV